MAQAVLTGLVEAQEEILNPWRYAVTIVARQIFTRHETQELTGSEIVSRQIDPVIFIHLLTTDNFLAQPCKTVQQLNFRKLSRHCILCS